MASIPPSTAMDYNSKVTVDFQAPDIPIQPIDEAEISKIAAATKQSLKIAKIQNDTADIDVNTEYINQLTNQLNYTTNCDVLQRIVKTHMKKLEDKAKSALDHEIKIVQSYLPIMTLPTSPFAIISWLPKLILGPISPQLQAEIKYVASLAKLAIAIEHLAEAIAKVAPKIEACAIQTLHQLEQEVQNLERQAYNETIGKVTNAIDGVVRDVNTAVNDIASSAISNVNGVLGPNNPISDQINAISQSVTITTSSVATDTINGIRSSVNSALAPALQRVNQIQNSIVAITGPSANVPMYDTSSANNFLTSHYAIGNTFTSAISNYVSSAVVVGPAFNGSVVSGNNLIRNVPSNTTITIGSTVVAADNSVPANTTVLAISNTAGSFTATSGATGSSVFTLGAPDANVVIGLTLTSSDPAFANGCTVTNVYGTTLTVSAPYLGTGSSSVTCNYVIQSIQMSKNATSTNASASITLNQMPVKLAGT